MTRVFDLHCDTLTDGFNNDYSLRGNTAHFDLNRIPQHWGWCQTMAIFIRDKLRGQPAIDYFNEVYGYFLQQLELNCTTFEQARTPADITRIIESRKTAAVLSVEGGAVLAGRLEEISRLAGLGVRMMTLTWNGANEIGGGASSDLGLTDFGYAAVRELERCRIAVDVSHLNDRTLEDVLKTAQKPVLASHSNSRTICSHRRNLTDSQFEAIAEMGGVVGLNLCCTFIDDSCQMDAHPDNRQRICLLSQPEMLIRHIWHLLELGGEDVLALGTDFDGATIPAYIGDVAGVATLRECMLQSGLGEKLTHKLLYKNALDFLGRL